MDIYKKFAEKFVIIAGPCAIESYEQMNKIGATIKDYIDIMRGGAFKPRTSPYSFQGLRSRGLNILLRIKKELALPVVTEVVDTRDVKKVVKVTDVIQIGTRSMQNFELLKEVGKTRKPILLKRGFGCTVEEWLGAAEYIKSRGNQKIILCERGIRTFEDSSRFTLDLGGAVVARQQSGLPTIIDPSHATGRTDLIEPLTLAAKAAGLNGVMIEVHCQPSKALCDSKQALKPNEFVKICKRL